MTATVRAVIALLLAFLGLLWVPLAGVSLLTALGVLRDAPAQDPLPRRVAAVAATLAALELVVAVLSAAVLTSALSGFGNP